ncbi:hypothetical protein AAVH_25300 [Aphelenchoides avenae]|nr:hypothetical protein AAVH_25300 [Aphelenchus avenae]
MRLSNDVLLDVCPCLSRWQLDFLQRANHQFFEVVTASKPLCSFRQFVNAEYKSDGIFTFDFNRGAELNMPQRLDSHDEENIDWALSQLNYSCVDRLCIGKLHPFLLHDLVNRMLTVRVNMFILMDIDASALDGPTFRRLIGGITTMKELSICDTPLQPEHLTDDLIRDCAERNVTCIDKFQGHDDFPQLSDASILDFFSIQTRGGRDEPSKMNLRGRGNFTSELLLKLVEAIEAGNVVSTFCLALSDVPEQRLEKYNQSTQTGRHRLVRHRLRFNDLNVEAGWGRNERLFVNRNHAAIECTCAVKMCGGRLDF